MVQGNHYRPAERLLGTLLVAIVLIVWWYIISLRAAPIKTMQLIKWLIAPISLYKHDVKINQWSPGYYTTYTHTFTWDCLTIQRVIQQVTFAVSIPTVCGMIDKFVTKTLPPWASIAFCALARVVDWPNFGLHIVFGSRVLKILRSLKWTRA